MAKRVLVTGSSGFLGRALCDGLRQRGCHVLGFCRSGGPGAVAGDLLVSQQIRSAVDSFAPAVVFNLAAQTDASPGPADFPVNAAGVENLVNAVATSKTVERAFWMSSQLVCSVDYRPKHDEDYHPDSRYGESKVRGEQVVRQSDGGGKCWTILRPTPVWGPGMRGHYLRLLRMIRSGIYFHVGSQPVFKSFGYVENTVDQMASLTEADKAAVNRLTFYLADSNPIEIRNWCEQFARQFGTRIPTVPLPVARLLALCGDAIQAAGVKNFPFTTRRLKNIRSSYLFDTRPIEAIAGPNRVDIKEGVRRTARWLQDIRP